MMLLLGEGDIYVHDGGMYQWDTAAPAGWRRRRAPRQPDRRLALGVQRFGPWLPDFLVCRPELADDVLHALWGER